MSSSHSVGKGGRQWGALANEKGRLGTTAAVSAVVHSFRRRLHRKGGPECGAVQLRCLHRKVGAEKRVKNPEYDSAAQWDWKGGCGGFGGGGSEVQGGQAQSKTRSELVPKTVWRTCSSAIGGSPPRFPQDPTRPHYAT